jgi:hypothetical protein
MEQRHMQFKFRASLLAVYVVLRCKQHSLQHTTGKSLMVLGGVFLVDTLHFPFALSFFQENEHETNLSRIFVTVARVGGGIPNSFLQCLCTSVTFSAFQ